MGAQRKRLGELLLETGRLNATQLDAALAEQKDLGCRLGTVLVARGILTEEMLAKFLSYQLDVPSVTLSEVNVPMEVSGRVPRELQEKHLAVPIAMAKEGKRDVLVLAMADPTDFSALDEIGFVTGCKVNAVVATEGAIRRYLGLDSIQTVTKADGDGAADMQLVQGVPPPPTSESGVPGFTSGSGYEPPPEIVSASSEAPLGGDSGMNKGRVGEQIIDLEGDPMGAGMTGGSGNPFPPATQPAPPPPGDPAPGFLGTEGAVASIPDGGAGAGVAAAPAAPAPAPAPVSFDEPAAPPPDIPDGTAEAFDPLGDPVVGTAVPGMDAGIAALPASPPIEDNTEPDIDIGGPGLVAPGPAPSEQPAPEISLGQPEAEVHGADDVAVAPPFAGGGTDPEPLNFDDLGGAGGNGAAAPEPLSLPIEDDLSEPETVSGAEADPLADPIEAASGEFNVPPEMMDEAIAEADDEEAPELSTASQMRKARESSPGIPLPDLPLEAPPVDAKEPEPEPVPEPKSAEPATVTPKPTPAPTVDAKMLKKLKLLEAVAEVLIEKGVITQAELRDHLRKKGGGGDS